MVGGAALCMAAAHCRTFSTFSSLEIRPDKKPSAQHFQHFQLAFIYIQIYLRRPVAHESRRVIASSTQGLLGEGLQNGQDGATLA